MNASQVATLIRKLRPPLLDGLAPVEVSAVLAAARHRRLLANSVMTNQEHPAKDLFMILTGCARSFFLTEGGQKLHVQSYLPGEIFGTVAMLSKPGMCSVSTEAVENSHALVWNRAGIRNLVASHPKLLDNALSIMANYMNVAIATQVSLSCHTARQRLAIALANLASGVGHEVMGGVELIVRNEELAAAANITPFTASRVMSDWDRSGMVRKSRGRVLLPSPERLLLEEV